MRSFILLAIPLTGFALVPADEPIPPPRPVPETVLQQREWIAKRAGQWKEIETLLLAEAILRAEKLVARDRAILGPDHPLLAESLEKLASLYRAAEDDRKAEGAFDELARLYAKIHGPDHWRVKDARHWAAAARDSAALSAAQRSLLRKAYLAVRRARDLTDSGDYRGATDEYETCNAVIADLLGSESYPVLLRLNDLGMCYTELAEYKLARETLNRCLKGVGKHLGKSHPLYATVLNSLGAVMDATGDYEQAIKLYEEALTVNRGVYGERHEACAQILANLGLAYFNAGNFRHAESLLLDGASIFREKLGPRSPEYATTLTLLGHLYFARGEYDRAEITHREALAVCRAWGKNGHPNTPFALNNLAAVYQAVGDYRAAAQLLREALEYFRKSVGEKHPSTALVAANLARMYIDAEWYDEAIAILGRVLTITRDTLGEKHPLYLRTLTMLALAYVRSGKPDKADSYLRAAVEIQKSNPAGRTLEYADSLSLAASATLLQGNVVRARALAEQAIKLRAAVLPPDHPSLSQDYMVLAEVSVATDKPRDARAYFSRALELEDQAIREGVGFTTESAMQLRFLQARTTLDRLLTFARGRPGDAETQELALLWVLRRKEMILNTLCRFRELLQAASNNPEVARQMTRVRRAFDAYMARLGSPIGTDEAAFRRELNTIRGEYLQQQADLHRILNRVRPSSMAKAEDLTLNAVRERIPAGTALVEFINYDPSDLAAPLKDRPYWQPRRCVAFVLTHDAAPKLIDLGETESLERELRGFRDALIRVPRELMFSDEKTLEEEFRTLAEKMTRCVFTPLRPALAGAKTVLVAPDGALNLLPFDALTENGQYLIESYRFRYLATGRDLLRPNPPRTTGAVVFAGPDYDWRPDVAPPPSVGGADTPDRRLVLRGVEIGQLWGLRWKPLQGAAGEAEDIQKALDGTNYAPVRVVTGAAARKNAFTSVRSPRLLHVATHGFFLPDRPVESEDVPVEGPARVGRRPGLPPLLRSGLVLTGANRVADPKAPAAVAEEGWLTAEEVALMNLRGTELVVLSACESGLRDVSQASEGMTGLRAAFQYAGAESVLVTLFKVADVETRALMKSFYQRLKDGVTPADALHDAKVDLIARRRKEHKAAHPFFWSSFVLVGSKG